MTDSNILYPVGFDGDDNLYHVNDAIRLVLVNDYNPGDTSILVTGNVTTLGRFPPTGLVTLTEQCSEINLRAVSFEYSSISTTTTTTFTGANIITGIISGLTLRPGFTDVFKPKYITQVTCNVMAEHHNSLKDALIAVQEFCGVKGTTDTQPFGVTLEGRINFLRNIVLQPRAWFEANVTIGNIPLEVEFTNRSFRLGTDGTSELTTVEWDFGDNTTSVVSAIYASSVVPNIPNVYVIEQDDDGTIQKTYFTPGLYSVTLTVTNDFGSDEITFDNLINARIPAPNEAVIDFTLPTSAFPTAGVPVWVPFSNTPGGQWITPGTPVDGPYTIDPTIRSPINSLIQIQVAVGTGTNPNDNPDTPGYSFAGEPLNNSGSPLDPVVSYTWALGDDLNHPNSPYTQAAYSVGGIYDLKLRVDTEFGAYRITTYRNSIDIVENTNLWMWIFTDSSNTSVQSYEYGLISETFKLNSNVSYAVTTDSSFLDGVPDSDNQKKEFYKNTGYATVGTITSGANGNILLYWASGRSASDPPTVETINFVQYNGFSDHYYAQDPVSRPWNWASFSTSSAAYFCFGGTTSEPLPNTSPTNPVQLTYNTLNSAVTSNTLTSADFENGAQELLQNTAVYDMSGNATYGNYSVTRTAWMNSTGYIARNDSVGPSFRIESFYGTEGTLGNPFRTVRKLINIQGPTLVEGELGSLSQGVYMFNNSGSIAAYSPSSSTWSTGGPGINSVAYLNLQDTTNPNYNNPANTLMVATDGDHRAYISFDYSSNVFLKFSEIDLTFSTLGARPINDQWITAIY